MVTKSNKPADRKPRTSNVAIDFGAVEVAEVAEPLRSTRSSKVDNTPVPGWLRESYESGKAKSVTLPHEQAKALIAMLRVAANRAGIGVKIVPENAGGGNTRVKFQGKPRRAYTPRKGE